MGTAAEANIAINSFDYNVNCTIGSKLYIGIKHRAGQIDITLRFEFVTYIQYKN